jgi:hypothetical protein
MKIGFVLLAFLNTRSASARSPIVGSVALSPVRDPSLSGGSWSTRAVADPYFTRPQVSTTRSASSNAQSARALMHARTCGKVWSMASLEGSGG